MPLRAILRTQKFLHPEPTNTYQHYHRKKLRNTVEWNLDIRLDLSLKGILILKIQYLNNKDKKLALNQCLIIPRTKPKPLVWGGMVD